MFAFNEVKYIMQYIAPNKTPLYTFKAISTAIISFINFYLKDLGYSQQTFSHFNA